MMPWKYIIRATVFAMGGRGYAAKKFAGSLGESSGGLQYRTHFGNVRIKGTVETASTLRDLLSRIDDPGVLKWMKKNPLKEILFASRTTEGGNGAYSRKKERIQIAYNRDTSKFGKEFVPGKTFSFSQLGKTRNEVIAGTLLHEIGHHVLSKASPKVQADARATFDSLGGKTATKYGRMNHSEHFSESFAAYFQHSSKLKSASPKAYAMIDRAVRSVGIR